MKKRGFTLIEIVVAVSIIASCLVVIFQMNSMSSRSSIDAYLELLAFQLAQEPLEVFRAFGYQFMLDYPTHPLPEYPVGRSPTKMIGAINRPPDALLFDREILFDPHPDKGYIKITVRVSKGGGNRIKTWLIRKSDIECSIYLFKEAS